MEFVFVLNYEFYILSGNSILKTTFLSGFMEIIIINLMWIFRDSTVQ
jgi:hypothetical protein